MHLFNDPVFTDWPEGPLSANVDLPSVSNFSSLPSNVPRKNLSPFRTSLASNIPWPATAALPHDITHPFHCLSRSICRYFPSRQTPMSIRLSRATLQRTNDGRANVSHSRALATRAPANDCAHDTRREFALPDLGLLYWEPRLLLFTGTQLLLCAPLRNTSMLVIHHKQRQRRGGATTFIGCCI